MVLDLPVYPPANLPATSANWGRETQQRIIRLQNEIALVQGRMLVTNRSNVSTFNKLAGQVRDLQQALNDLASVVEEQGEIVDTLADTVERQAELVTYNGASLDNLVSTYQSGDVNDFTVLDDQTPTVNFTLNHDMQIEITFIAQVSVQASGSAANPLAISAAGRISFVTAGETYLPGGFSSTSATQGQAQHTTYFVQRGLLYTTGIYNIYAGNYTTHAKYEQQGGSDTADSVYVAFYSRKISVRLVRRANLPPLP